MLAHDIVVAVLLAVAAATAAVELGLSAYLIAELKDFDEYEYIDPDTSYEYDFYYGVPGQVSFLAFDSAWTLLVTAFLLIVAFVPRRSSSASGKVLAIVTLVLTSITMVLWLAGFAALAAFYGGFDYPGYPDALLAFAVIPWLIFLALMILNFLTASGVLTSERRDRGRLFGRTVRSYQGGAGQPVTYESVPMHTQKPYQQQYQQQPPQQPYQQQYQQSPPQQPYQQSYQQQSYQQVPPQQSYQQQSYQQSQYQQPPQQPYQSPTRAPNSSPPQAPFQEQVPPYRSQGYQRQSEKM